MTISLNFWFTPRQAIPDNYSSTTPVQHEAGTSPVNNAAATEVELLKIMRYVEELLGDNLQNPKQVSSHTPSARSKVITVLIDYNR